MPGGCKKKSQGPEPESNLGHQDIAIERANCKLNGLGLEPGSHTRQTTELVDWCLQDSQMSVVSELMGLKKQAQLTPGSNS